MAESNLGIYLIIAMMAMAISMVIIPIMIRLAPRIGMVDLPDPRKVHVYPIPRVGGVGIVIGTLLPLLIWLPVDSLAYSFLFGSFVLLVFGVWDDIKELGHYVKFVGQFVAAIAIVYYGHLYVIHFPLMGLDSLPESIGRPFTVVAIVGMVNAINHSDGLDGLAGGESLLSLGAVAFLAYQFDGAMLLIIAAASIGGIFGFLRFNSHPAQVFMGDGGSQFLGFTLAVLVIMLTQNVNAVISPALPVFRLGLPIVDILAVFVLRARSKVNLFAATRNHIHHRLLDLGFYHYESVMIIYSIQIFFIVCAVLMPYESDYVILIIYFITCALVFILLTLSERRDWRAHEIEKPANATNFFIKLINEHNSFKNIPYRILEASMTLLFLGAAFMSTDIPMDFGVSSLVLLSILIVVILTGWLYAILYRLIVYVSIAFSVYLLSTYTPEWLFDMESVTYFYYLIIMAVTFVTVRWTVKSEFQITPLDYLVIVMALIIGLVSELGLESSSVVWMAIQLIILFYASELIIQKNTNRFNGFTGSMAIALALISVRGLM